MKRIEDIEKLSIEELENLASQQEEAVPVELDGKIRSLLTAQSLVAESRSRKAQIKRFAFVPALAASLAAVLIGVNSYDKLRTPADSFTSPQEAYSQVEEAFKMIGNKASKGKSLTDAALPRLDKTSEFIEKLM